MYENDDLADLQWMPPHVILRMMMCRELWIEDIDIDIEDRSVRVVSTDIHPWHGSRAARTDTNLVIERNFASDIYLTPEVQIVADRRFLRCGDHYDAWSQTLGMKAINDEN